MRVMLLMVISLHHLQVVVAEVHNLELLKQELQTPEVVVAVQALLEHLELEEVVS